MFLFETKIGNELILKCKKLNQALKPKPLLELLTDTLLNLENESSC
jgi:hypothetical protein